MGRRRKPKYGKLPKPHVQPERKTSMEDLPIDVAFNILQRLPITSFFTVKLASKYFYRLASDPDLVSHYHLHENSCGYIIRTLSGDDADKLCFSFPENTDQLYFIDRRRGRTEIVQPWMKKEHFPGPMLSSNGLLCLLSYKRNHLGLDSYRVCLFNPWTGEHDFLTHPLSSVRGSSHEGTMVWSSQFFGFGFDVKTEKYKLVRIVKLSYEDGWSTCKAEAFTLRKNGGPSTKIKPPFACPDQSSDVVVGGAIHWLCQEDEKTIWPFDHKPKSILSFDFFEEKFHQMATPEPDCECCKISSRRISVLGGCLAITADHQVTYGRHEVHIWLLKEYGVKESWTKQFKIGEGFQRFYPLFLLHSGEIVMSDEWKVVCWYDPEKDCCEVYAELNLPVAAIYHVPSLVSPFL